MLLLKTLLSHSGEGIAVTMLVDADPRTVLFVPDTPRAVAQSYQWYFQQYLGLPVTVAVRMRELDDQFPAPDGRKLYRETPYTDLYSAHGITVIDRHQQAVLEFGDWRRGFRGLGSDNAKVLAKVVAHEMAKQ
jgi:hypothetical protein